ncbi:MAG: hypothetical protein EAX86_04235 [Candidatus Heimdallarchaeota archaeon]|nr:hypothetical protein [Candidatus Heimdallarchaeota archaeon]
MEITATKSSQNRFYIITTDLIQGIFLFFFVIGHTGLWWDSTLDVRWPNIPILGSLLVTFALVIPPGFLFLYAFNTVNSLLRRETKEERLKSRIRVLKRGILFLAIAEIAEASSALVVSPEHLFNFLLTWELFHMFGLASFVIIIIFELAWRIEEKFGWNYKKNAMMLMLGTAIITLCLYLIFHDYSLSTRIKGLYVELTWQSILERAVFELGQAPIIPFLTFPMVGGLVSTFLDLPYNSKEIIRQRMGYITGIGIVAMIVGFLLLRIEPYVGPPVFYPASSPLVFFSIGSNILMSMLGIYFLDLDSLYGRKQPNKILLPIVLVSKITFTVYIVHNFAYVIPSDLPIIQTLIPNLNIVILAGFLYACFFIAIAAIWQKWRFKFSLEWWIVTLQNKSWLWWLKN